MRRQEIAPLQRRKQVKNNGAMREKEEKENRRPKEKPTSPLDMSVRKEQ